MTTWDFAWSDPIDISISHWTSGSVVVSGEPTSSVVVEVVSRHRNDELIDQVQVAFEDGQLYVHGPRFPTFRRWQGLDLTIKVPPGSTCAAKTASADLSCVGDISAVSLHTASGDLTAASIGDVAMRSASGDVLLDRVSGTLFVHTASGDVSASRTDGDVRINSASGDVAIGFCGGPVAVHTASGDVKLSAVAAGRVELASGSGDLVVAVVPGLGVYLDLASHSGDIRSELDPSEPKDSEGQAAAVEPETALFITCRTTSGDIKIARARAVPSELARA
jgi:Putative adhesin